MATDLAKWIIVGMAIVGLIYNTGVTHGVLKNDIKHLKKSVDDIWSELNTIKKFLWEEKDKK